MSDQSNAPKASIFDVPEKPILWKDRKRILGMPLSFTRYSINEDRLISRIGLIRTITDETLLYRILDIKMTQSLWQKICGVGSLMLFTADQSNLQFELTNIKHPEKVRRALSELVERERTEKRMLGREMFGAAAGIFDAAHDGMIDANHDGIPD